MRVDITSMFFNSSIEGQTATAAWATSIAKQSKPCFIYENTDCSNIINGMLFCSKSDNENLSINGMSSSRELIMFAVFDKVKVNGTSINGSFILLLVREHSTSHEGRILLSYPMYAQYQKGESLISNEETKNKIASSLGCTNNGCWFVYDISIENQDTLCFEAKVVDPNNNKIYTGSSKDRSKEWKELIGDANKERTVLFDSPLQQIYYGAPGTGKSHTINETTKNSPKENVFRTTFHPDSDYSTFIGCYKPKMVKAPIRDGSGHEITNACDEEKKRISYEFEPQSFLKAYVRAYETLEPVYLVIEEINRGNCAQIFGDMFQLLDRDENGKSDYRIKPETSIQDFLREKLANLDIEDEAIKSGEEMQLPANLYIWATMNTSDQSLFPIDSAFKRRWDWKYVSISNANKGYKIDINGKQYDWWQFLDRVNTCIGKVTSSEDKKLGYFFCKADKDNNTITADRFVNKVIFYIWGDVLKDYEPSELQFTYDNENLSLMTYKDNGNDIAFNFSSFFKADGEVNCDMARKMLENIGLKPIGKNDDGNLQQDANAEDDTDKQANDNA